MTELDRALVRRKLATIARNLADLQPLAGLSVEEYVGDRMRRKAVERLLQELIEAAVDTNLHILRVLGVATPEDYYTSFTALGRHRVLDQPLANRLAPSAGLRNRLVHEYDEIDDRIVLRALGAAVQDYRDYLAQIERYLEVTP